MALTFAPDPVHLLAGAGTAAQQSARPRLFADHANGGWAQAATGATAGAPGSFTPAGSFAPASFAGMAGLTANPATKWTVGQYVAAANGDEAYWSATAWVSGRAPATQAASTTNESK